MKQSACCFFFILLCALNTDKTFAQKYSRVALFNGKDLNGWDTYLGPPLDDAGKKLSDIPVGLNNDPKHVFTVVQQDGEKVIRISGENWGGISTKQEYADFHLHLLFKWGILKWGQKKNRKRDSGLLYFASVIMALIMVHGCAHRNFKLKKATVAIIGVLQAECRIFPV